MPLPQLVKHYGDVENGRFEFHLPFNFRLIFADWHPATVRGLAEKYERLLPPGAWPNWVLGNHDRHRIAGRVGAAQARVAMMLLLTLRGTPTIYYGDELGMLDGEIPPDRVQDPWEIFVPGIGLGRDPERTPMQWSNSEHAGFCESGVVPWLPVNENKTAVNVTTQKSDPPSMLTMAKSLIALRQSMPALHSGDFQALDTPEALLAYVRFVDNQRVLTVLNFSNQPQS